MAFDFFSDEENQNQGGEQQGAPQDLGPQGSPIITSNTPQQAGKPSSSGTFTNLNAYLDANKGRQFGQEVAGKVQKQVDEASQAQGDAETGFRSRVDQGTTRKDDSLLDLSDPESLANDPNKYNRFVGMRDASYKGPNALSDDSDLYSSVAGKTDKAKQTADLTGSEAGRKAYLQQEYGSGVGRYDYTPGQQKLDNLLIQNDEGARTAFDNVRKNAGATAKKFTDLNSYLQNYANQGKQSTQDARASTRAALGIDDAGNYLEGKGAIGSTVSDLDKRLAQRQAEEQAQRTKLNQQLTGKTYYDQFDPNANLGVVKPGAVHIADDSRYFKGWDAPEGYLYGNDPSNARYQHDVAPEALSRSSVGTAADLARINALTKLANINNTFITDPSQLGKYTQGDLADFDENLFNQDVGQKRNAYQSEMQHLYDTHQNTGDTSAGNQISDPTAIRNAINEIRRKYGLPATTYDTTIAGGNGGGGMAL